MDLRRFKWVSLLLLAVTLTLLALGYFSASKKSGVFPDAAITDLVSLLEKGGIHVDRALIPTEKVNRAVYETETDSAALERLAVALCGTARKDANLTTDGVCFRMSDGALVTLSHTLTLDASFGTALPLASGSPAKALTSLFSSLTADASHVSYAPAAPFADGRLPFTATLDGLPVLDASLVATVTEDGCTALAGDAYLLPLTRLELSPKYDLLNILTAEHRFHSSQNQPEKTIVALTECYLCRARDGAVRFLPGYAITYADGSRSVYDTVSGEAVTLP